MLTTLASTIVIFPQLPHLISAPPQARNDTVTSPRYLGMKIPAQGTRPRRCYRATIASTWAYGGELERSCRTSPVTLRWRIYLVPASTCLCASACRIDTLHSVGRTSLPLS